MGTDKRKTLSDWVRRGASVAPAERPSSAPPEISEVVQVLSGDLNEKTMSWILMAAQHYDATGRLYVGPAACNVTIQFGLGAPIHAYSPFVTGAEALMDLFLWKDGRVRFEPGKPPDSATVQESVEELVARGEDYIRNMAFLGQHAINEMSFLLRAPGRLSEGELKQRLAMGKPIDLKRQTEFFGNIYGTANLKDVAERMSLQQSEWVAIATNMLELGLLLAPNGCSLKIPDKPVEGTGFPTMQMAVPPNYMGEASAGEVTQKISGTSQMFGGAFEGLDLPVPPPIDAPAPAPAPPPSPVPVPAAAPAPPMPMGGEAVQMGVPSKLIALDPSKTESVWALLRNPDTGILSADSLQFFLEREFARAYRFKSILTLVLFCIKLNATADGFMSQADCAVLTGALNKIKREVDMLGHFGTAAFGLLLPNVDGYQASSLVDRINAELPGIAPQLGRYKPSLHFGIASVPYDATDLIGLVQTSQRAMFDAASLNMLKVQANQTKKHT
jgi:GGDEF domain-containing protein